MSRDVLVRIKRAILVGNYVFSEKASLELEADGLTELDAVESIVNFRQKRQYNDERKTTDQTLPKLWQ